MNDLTGTEFNEYQLEERIGSGTSGTVYRATDLKNGRIVALKIIHAHLAAQPDFRERFLKNEEAYDNLKHRTIARVFDLDENGPDLYQSTELVTGSSLARLLQSQSAMGLQVAARLIELVADGLAYAHRQGVVHGAIHPHNILLKAHGGELPWRPLLTDFRQASMVPPGQTPTAVLPYLSPEQCDGKRASGRSDIYSLGILLYQFSTGLLPLNPQTPQDILRAPAPNAPRSLQPNIPAALEAIILRAMAKQAADRFRSMEEFLLMLRREIGRLPRGGAAAFVPAAAAAAAAPPPQVRSEPPPAPKPAPKPKPKPAAPHPPATSSDSDYLIISHASQGEKQFQLDKWLVTIGQMAGNDLLLTGEGVAKKHARLERTDMGWDVVDMGSLNGTILEGSSLLPDVPEPWRSGQILKIGTYELEWRSGTGSAPAVAAEAYAPPPVEEPLVDRGRVYISMGPDQLTTVPGMPAGSVLELENQFERTVSITLEVSGIPVTWVAIDPAPIRLGQQQKVTVPFTIRPPRSSDSTAGSHTFQIAAKVSHKAVETAVCQGQLAITPFPQFYIETHPSPLKNGQKGEVVIFNEGNIVGQYTLAAADVENKLKFQLPPNQVAVHPGDSQAVPFTARARRRPFFLRSKIIPYELQVKANEIGLAEKGRLIAPPYIAWWIIPLIILPLILLLLFGGRTLFCSDETVNPVAFPRIFPSMCSRTPAISSARTTATPTAVPTTENVVTDVADGEAVVDVDATVTPFPTATATVEAIATQEGVVSSRIIGQSVNGVDIEANIFGDGPNGILFVGGMHAGNAPASIDLANQLGLALRGNPDLVPPDATIYIVPNINPDGNGRLNANGVDLNRNWACNWETLADGRSGPSALSEPESEALFNFATEISPAVAIFWDSPARAANQSLVSPGRCSSAQVAASQALADLYVAAMDGYTADQADTAQSVSGDATDSLADEGIPAVYVLLDSPSAANLDDHMVAIQALFEEYAGP
ncbi:MAG: protein kinase [Chloroflexi bacterium]|nr:protein kinase [Chloroflexota bacterium]